MRYTDPGIGRKRDDWGQGGAKMDGRPQCREGSA